MIQQGCINIIKRDSKNIIYIYKLTDPKLLNGNVQRHTNSFRLCVKTFR